MRNERIIFACAVRNCEQYLDAVCSNIFNLGSLFKEYKIIFVESDSSDRTIEILKTMKKELFIEAGISLD